MLVLTTTTTSITQSTMALGSFITDIPQSENISTLPITSCGDSLSSRDDCYPSQSARVFLTIFLVVVNIIALFGNIMLGGIVYRRSAMRSAINLLLANIAMTDFFIALLHLPFVLTVLNVGRWPFGGGMCKFNGFVFMLLNCEKVMVLVGISIDRYFIIVKRCDTLTPNKSKCLLACSWLISFLIAMPPLLGWGVYGFTHGSLQCLPLENADENGHTLTKGYTIFSTMFAIILPFLALCFIYHRILRTVRRNGFRVQNHPPVTPTAMHKKGKYFIDYSYKTRTSTTILLLSLIFLLTMLPLGIVNFYIAFNGLNSFDIKHYSGFLVFCYLHSGASPLLYYWRIKKYRESINDIGTQIFVLPHCVFYSGHRERRIRPHTLYKVETMDDKYNITEI